MADLLKGAPVSKALGVQTTQLAAELAAKGCPPTLAIVRLGERPDDLAYENSAIKRCQNTGIAVQQVLLPANAPQAALVAALQKLNADSAVHGVLLLRPLPAHMDDQYVRNVLLPQKDIDGITDLSLAGVFTGSGVGYAPCTAQACLELLSYYGIDPAGKRVAVLGRSLVIGRPVAMMLLAANATVTICHTKTRDVAATCRKADILIAAAGRAGIVDAGYLADGQVVIDVGINVAPDGSLCGDVDAKAAEALPALRFTPVPGGVGTVTNAVLAAHVVQAARLAAGM